MHPQNYDELTMNHHCNMLRGDMCDGFTGCTSGLYALMSYMSSQRRKALGGGKGKRKAE